jgi:hypothetical protein
MPISGKVFVILKQSRYTAKSSIMERIDLLIHEIREQFDQKADPSRLLMIVQQLQQELNGLQGSNPKTFGTSKVAVVMPAGNAVPPQYEKYAPRSAEQESETVKEVKETILVDEGTVSVVQKNGQLDMVFDPMKEIPTLSHQTRDKEVNDSALTAESLNDKLRQGKTELIEVLKEAPVKDLRKAVGINDRFLFINELFRGDESMYERSIKTINSFNIYPEAEYWINRELKVKLGWNSDSIAAQHFYQLVKRRFS